MEDNQSNAAPVLKIIKLAFMASVVIYPAIAFVVIQSDQSADRAPIDDTAPYLMVAALVALVSLVLSFWVPGLIASDQKIEQALRSSVAPGESPTPEGARTVLFPAFIIKLALLEAIALFGLVLAFIVWNGAYAIGFSVVSLVFLAMARPETERAEAICRRIDQ